MSRRRRVLCYGDSNTWGYVPGSGDRYPDEVRWPGRLAARLGGGATVVEEGLNSRTTVFDDPLEPGRNGLAYLVPCLATHAPIDLVILMLGSNDTKRRFAVGAHDIALGVARLARTVRASEAGPGGAAPDLLIVAPPALGPFDEFADLFVGAERTSRLLAERLRTVASDLSCTFLDASLHVAVDPLDGVHLDAESHAELATAIYKVVRDGL